MKITHLASATSIIESEDVKILMDPWLEDGEYYGSWYHYPKIDKEKLNLDDVTHIYVSHIHPDHFSIKTFQSLNKNIPVYIHKYDAKFLKMNLERLGFKVFELDNGYQNHITDKVSITIFAADNCNPELCSKFLGCAPMETKYGSTQIDSLAVISDGKHNLLNLNDCPYELSDSAIKEVLKKFKHIDFLLVGYCGAGPYPQCFEMDQKSKVKAAKEKKLHFLNLGLKFIKKIKPKYYMPFAGTYILSGSLSHLNHYRGIPELHEALDYYISKTKSLKSKGILLNQSESFDLKTGVQSNLYKKVDPKKREKYIVKALKVVKFRYQNEEIKSEEEIINLIPKAFERFKDKKRKIGFNSNTNLLISISKNSDLLITLDNNPKYEIVQSNLYKKMSEFVKVSLDNRLLFNLLNGPKFAHWNNAEVGSHLTFLRSPNKFERGLYHCLYFLHV